MVEHLTQTQFEGYCRQQLPAAELLSVSAHLGECEACRRRVEAQMSDAAFFSVRSAIFEEDGESGSHATMRAHLTPEEIGAYVDGKLSGEELQFVDDHLTVCEECVLGVDDLRAYSNEIAPSLNREFRPTPVVPARESWWRRTFRSIPAFFRVSPIPAFGLTLALVFVGVLAWLSWRTLREGEPKQEIVVAPTPSLQPSSPVQPAPTSSRPEPASVIAQLKDGEGVLSLDQQGNLAGADNLPPTYQSIVKKALTSGRIEKSSQLNGLTRPGSSLMSLNSETDRFSVIEPGGNVLMNDRPTFRWSTLEGATGYIVEIYSAKFQLVSTSPQLTTQSWKVPTPLSRGMVYSWQVKAIKEGQEIISPRPPAPQAKFRILEQAKVNELSRAKRNYPSSHLTLGLLYAEAGLLKEAEAELRAVQKANPDSELARSLLRQVQATARRRK